MSNENPFSNLPQEPQEQGSEQEKEKNPNIIEETTPEGKVVRIDIEEEMRRQGVDPAEFKVDDSMREKLREGIKKGFTSLIFTPHK